MSEETPENPIGIGDDQLPDDLVAGDDNPLAEGLPAGETVGDLLDDGKRAEPSEDAGVAGVAGGSEAAGDSDRDESGEG